MRATFSLNNADDLEASMTITMKVKDWRALKKTLSDNNWPECDLFYAIGNVVEQAEAKFFARDKQA